MKFENIQNNSNSVARGGARKNAGRKAGVATKKTREIANQASKEGITPLEVLLLAMRDLFDTANAMTNNVGGVPDSGAYSRLDLLTKAASIAKDAAPYMHPRLTSIQHTGKGGESLNQGSGVLLVPGILEASEWQRLAKSYSIDGKGKPGFG